MQIEYAKLPYTYVSVGDIIGTFDDVVDYTDWEQWETVTNYDWNKMRESIETHGLINHLLITERHTVSLDEVSLNTCPWRCQDGNHNKTIQEEMHNKLQQNEISRTEGIENE